MSRIKISIVAGLALIVSISIFAIATPIVSAKASDAHLSTPFALLWTTLFSHDDPAPSNSRSVELVGATCAAPPADQVSWYRFEGNANDQIGSNGGTLVGGSFAGGNVGQGYSAGSGNHVFVPPSAGTDIGSGGQFTIEGWVNLTDVGTIPGAIALYQPALGTGDPSTALYRNSFSGHGVAFFQAYIFDTNGVSHLIVSPTPGTAPFNNFNHVALTYSNISGLANIYVNGVAVATENMGSFTPKTTDALHVGGGHNSISPLNGVVDELGFYNRALSQTEIQSIVDAGTAGKCVPPPQISPAVSNATTGDTVNFSASGGTAPYTFSIFTNNTGGSINPSTGVYTAGPIGGADTVRVTDASNATSDATVNVTAGCVLNQKTWDGGGSTENWSEPANWTCNALPTVFELAIFNGTSTKNAIIDVNPNPGVHININSGYTGTITTNGNIALPRVTQNAGLFVCGAGDLTTFGINSDINVNGGRFDCSAANLDAGAGIFRLNGGTFDLPSGVFTLGRTNGAGQLTRQTAATLNHSNGTVILRQSNLNFVGPAQDFNNVTVTTGNTALAGTLRVLGSLDLQSGALNGSSGHLEALGNMTVASTYPSSSANSAIHILETATTPLPRTITLPTGMPTAFNPMVVNALNTTVTTSGPGPVMLRGIALQAGAIDTGNAAFSLFTFGAFPALYTQSGGTFTCGGGNASFDSTFTLNGGIFDCTASDLTLATIMQLNAGTFKAPSGTLTLSDANFRKNTPAVVFQHNNGTVRVIGNFGQINVENSTGSLDLYNLDVETIFSFTLTHTLRVFGDLRVASGNLKGGNLELHGDVTIESGVNDNSDNPLDVITFSGPAAQTYTNNGGSNPRASWRIDKPTGATVTAASSFMLDPLFTVFPSFSILGGTFYLNPGSNLTTGNLTIASGGRLVSESSTTITLGGNVSNSGVIDLQGGGAACPETDSILIRSTSSAQRSWTGSGIFRLVDVDVQNMSGAGTKNVFSGTNSGGNNATWVFDPNCSAGVSISPTFASVQTGSTRLFTANGGFVPYTFSIVTNNSGGSINPTSGLYTAGAAVGVFDTIRVTDAFGATADANVTTFGPATRLVFNVQPSNTTAGAAITPSIKVSLLDEAGQVVTNSSASVTLSLAQNPSGGILSGTLARSAVNGVATFDNISINNAGAGYRLQAASAGLSPQNSSAFSITAESAAKLGFVVQPPNADAGAQFSLSVAVQDSLGNTVTTASNTVNLTLEHNPTGTTLQGTTSRNAVNGIANFNGLQINAPGNGYTIRAVSNPLTQTTSDPFDIANPFVVTNTNDSGPGSLREAIGLTNATAGLQTITFNIAGTSPFVITPVSPLPTITDQVVIDGATQPGFTGAPVVQIDGVNFLNAATGPNGLHILAGNTTIRGLSITNFRSVPLNLGRAILIENNGANNITGNWLGISPTGVAGRNIVGVKVSSSGNTIGGVTVDARNIISGNNIGIELVAPASNTTIRGNYIGVGPSGINSVGNNAGLLIRGSDHHITDNIISGNTGPALSIDGLSNRNFIGTNRIGLNVNGTVIGNGAAGVIVSGNTSQNTIFRNRIAGSGGGRLGIKLSNGSSGFPIDTPLLNDAGDVDGAGVGNLGQNYPVLSAATSVSGNIRVTGSLNSRPAQTFTIEFFSSVVCHASGNGEGETFLGSINVATGGGIVGFDTTFATAVPVGHMITATATDAFGNTSEFSRCLAVAPATHAISGRILFQNGVPLRFASVRIAETSQTTVTDSSGNYRFANVPGGRSYTLVPSLSATTFAPASLFISNLSSDVFNQNFTATQQGSVIGKVESQFGGSRFGVSGVTLDFSGPQFKTVQTNTFGNFSTGQLLTGNYQVTAFRSGYSFSTFFVTVNANSVSVLNIFGQPPPLLGRVLITDDSNLRIMNADGSASYRLGTAANGTTLGKPSINRNGGVIAFTRFQCPAANPLCLPTQMLSSVFTANFDGSDQVRAAGSSGNTSFLQPALSHDATKLAFVQKSGGALDQYGSQAIFVQTRGSGVAVQVFAAPAGTIINNLAWSPDGSQLAFVQRRANAGPRIYTTTIASPRQLVQLTTSNSTNPTWSPNGTQISYISGGRAFKMNSDGTAQTLIGGPSGLTDLVWSPDGGFLGFIQNGDYGVMTIDGNQTTILRDDRTYSQINWARGQLANVGGNLGKGPSNTVTAGAVDITFSDPDFDGDISVIPVPAESAGPMPANFVATSMAYDISTSSPVTGSVEVCLRVGPDLAAILDQLHILHEENGSLIDRTTSRDTVSGRVCATTFSLSKFVLAEIVNDTLPRISGIAYDSSGMPMADVLVTLSGDADRTTHTDSSGTFIFVNLTSGANYNVSPKQVGYLFEQYNQDFVDLTDEQTVAFAGTPTQFAINGRVVDGSGDGVDGATVTLDGAAQSSVQTDSNGDYVFTGVPADGFYIVTPSDGANIFNPGSAVVDPLTGDVAGVDFQIAFAPTAANVSVSGRVLTANGYGIRDAILTLTEASGRVHVARSSSFGYYSFDEIPVGQTVIVSISTKRYVFSTPTRVLNLADNVNDLEFIAEE